MDFYFASWFAFKGFGSNRLKHDWKIKLKYVRSYPQQFLNNYRLYRLKRQLIQYSNLINQNLSNVFIQ